MKAVMGYQEFKGNPVKAIRERAENIWDKKQGMAL